MDRWWRQVAKGGRRFFRVTVFLALGIFLGGWAAMATQGVAAGGGAGSATPAAPAPDVPGQELKGQSVAPGEVKLSLRVVLPAGYKFTPEAPSQVKLSSSNPQVLAVAPAGNPSAGQAQLPLEASLQALPGEARLVADLNLFFCKTDGGLCMMKELRLSLPVKVTPEAPSRQLEVVYQVQAP